MSVAKRLQVHSKDRWGRKTQTANISAWNLGATMGDGPKLCAQRDGRNRHAEKKTSERTGIHPLKTGFVKKRGRRANHRDLKGGGEMDGVHQRPQIEAGMYRSMTTSKNRSYRRREAEQTQRCKSTESFDLNPRSIMDFRSSSYQRSVIDETGGGAKKNEGGGRGRK